MGVISRGTSKIKAFAVVIILVGFSGLLDNLDYFWSQERTLVGAINMIKNSAWHAYDNLFASLWSRIVALKPNIVAGHIGSVIWDIIIIFLAIYLVYFAVFLLLDLWTGDQETPGWMAALISIGVTVLIAYILRGSASTAVITNATQTIANQSTLSINLTGVGL